MALTDASTFQTLADALGLADKELQDQLSINTSGTASNKVRAARDVIKTASLTGTGTTATYLNTYESSMLALEGTLKTALDGALASSVTSANTFITSSTGSSFRDWFNATTTERTLAHSTDYFRDLWRRTRNEELIVKLSTYTKSAGSWGSVAGKSIQLSSLLEVRTGTSAAIGAANIIVNVYFKQADGTSTTSPATLTIDAATAAGTKYALGGTTKYYGIYSATISGGTNGDVVEFWLR